MARRGDVMWRREPVEEIVNYVSVTRLYIDVRGLKYGRKNDGEKNGGEKGFAMCQK
jgi:hypothetical protein